MSVDIDAHTETSVAPTPAPVAAARRDPRRPAGADRLRGRDGLDGRGHRRRAPGLPERRRRPPGDGGPGGRRDPRGRPADDDRPRRPAARLGPARARPPAGFPRLRTRPHGALLRALRDDGRADVPLRRANPGSPDRARTTRCASATRDCGSSGATRRPSASSTRTSSARSRRHQRLERPTSCGWAPASPSRRSGWPRCATASTPRILAGVGAAFDFHAGIVPQAPAWMQRVGLEWSYRLAREPRRLWRRYARYNPRFVAGFLRQYVAHRRGG